MFPYVANELTEELNVLFPDKSPTEQEDDNGILNYGDKVIFRHSLAAYTYRLALL